MCLNPKLIKKSGKYKESNYRGSEGEFYEIETYSKCGSCEICIAEKCNNWVIRNYYESKVHQDKCFVTLTYEENPYILVRKDMQDFLKRLRRRLEYKNEKKIRMFYAGEYGEKKGRPHWHIIIYGWKDKNPKYLGINKKTNLIYQSKLIQSTWGLGRTSYQDFGDYEIPYVALYNTPQEDFKKAYKLTREKAKSIEQKILNNEAMPKSQRINTIKELYFYIQEIDKNKSKYTLVREKQGWSQALGWAQFYDEYSKMPTYPWTEYIEDKEFVTPTPWVKKLANMGDIAAAKEMYKREEMIIQSANEEEEIIKNMMKINRMRKKEIIDWNEQKTEIEEVF